MADRLTKVIGGNGTSVQAFTLDPGLFQYVQSVLVTVDNTAGPDITPTLTVETNNGTPLADKTQGTAIPAGDTGRATWALRLTDEGTGTPAGGADVQLLWEYTVPAGGQSPIDTNADGAFAGPLAQTFNVLEVFTANRSDENTNGSSYSVRFNGDSGAHYDFEFSQVQSNPVATSIANSYNQTGFSFATLAALDPASRPGSAVLVIPGYASTLLHKTGTAQARQPGGSGFAGAFSRLTQWGINWHPLAVAGIDRIVFTVASGAKFAEGSFFAVYGRK